MKGSIRGKGKTWSYRVYVSTVDGQNKQIEKGGFKTKNTVCYYEQTGVSKRKELTELSCGTDNTKGYEEEV